MSNDKYTPDMDRLKTELGRAPPPSVPTSKPEDYAPKRERVVRSDSSEYMLSQLLKSTMRDTDGWHRLTPGEREALDLIATSIGRICVGRDYWDELAEHAALGKTANKEP